MYERFFGLRDMPFRLTPDPRYLYLSRKHAEALAHLRLSPLESSGFVCITGEVGTGKTTLVRTFLDGLGPEVAVAFIVDPVLTATELLRRINREFGLPAATDSRIDLVDALNAHLLEQHRRGRISIVVIDEAQALPPPLLEQLRLLSNLETTTDKLLRIVLVGQPQLRATLRDPALAQLNQRITLRWHIGALSGRETAAYVRHRLAVAGSEDTPALLTRPAVWLLHRLAQGIPRLINMIGHRALLAAYAERRRPVRLRQVVRAYREIATVPLPRRRLRPRPSWAVAVAAVLVVAGVALGVSNSWAPTLPVPDQATAKVMLAVPSAPTPAMPALASLDDIRGRLASVGEDGSLEAAVAAVLAAWHERPLTDGERVVPLDLAGVARDRGLEVVSLTGGLRTLRAFDLPAILELDVDGISGRRHVTVTRVDEDVVTLAIGDTTIVAAAAVVGRAWSGRARLLWRDFENLGPAFGKGTNGAQVERLQHLLQRAGLYAGPLTTRYDDATDQALLRFQDVHMLADDGLVGRLTRIALYTVAGGYRRPTLTGTESAEARS
jgi:general secretion pathway protein A